MNFVALLIFFVVSALSGIQSAPVDNESGVGFDNLCAVGKAADMEAFEAIKCLWHMLITRRFYMAREFRRHFTGSIMTPAIRGEHLVIATVKWGDVEMMKALIGMDIPLSVSNESRETALDIALVNRKKAMYNLLLSNGATLELNNMLKVSAFEAADANDVELGAKLRGIRELSKSAHDGDLERVMGILATGNVPIDGAYRDGKTALHGAVSKNHVSVARYLVRMGANLEQRDIAGMTPLVLAAYLGFAEMAKVLVICGADINSKSHTDHTVLAYAITANLPPAETTEFVRFLLSRGADRNPSGIDLVGLAQRRGLLPIARLLDPPLSSGLLNFYRRLI